jgi:membrane protein YqaA with SNARE-associated domain
MRYLFLQYGYFGIFVASLAGALSIVVPIPDTIVVFTLAGFKVGGNWVFEPLLIASAATIGATIGQSSGYLLGFTSRKALTGSFKKNADFLAQVLNKFGALAIFAFALTPLPDDLVFIPLGAAHYNPFKAFPPALVGKFLVSLLIAYGGRFSIGIIANMFGEGSNLVSVLIGTVVGIILAVAMFKVDWTRYFSKYLTKKASYERLPPEYRGTPQFAVDEQLFLRCGMFASNPLCMRCLSGLLR